MNKPALLTSLAFATFCTCVNSDEIDYLIKVSFDSHRFVNPYGIAKLVNIHSYCMSKYGTPDTVLLDGSAAKFNVETNDFFLTKCAYVHSSITYAVVDFDGVTQAELEFYKPVGDPPYLIFSSSGRMKCHISGLSLTSCNDLEAVHGL